MRIEETHPHKTTTRLTGVYHFMTDKILSMFELHLAMATCEALIGSTCRVTLTEVRLQCADLVEELLAHVASIQFRQLSSRLR